MRIECHRLIVYSYFLFIFNRIYRLDLYILLSKACSLIDGYKLSLLQPVCWKPFHSVFPHKTFPGGKIDKIRFSRRFIEFTVVFVHIFYSFLPWVVCLFRNLLHGVSTHVGQESNLKEWFQVKFCDDTKRNSLFLYEYRILPLNLGRCQGVVPKVGRWKLQWVGCSPGWRNLFRVDEEI